jgi:hypothetical protein
MAAHITVSEVSTFVDLIKNIFGLHARTHADRHQSHEKCCTVQHCCCIQTCECSLHRNKLIKCTRRHDKSQRKEQGSDNKSETV